jgi:hypothetical protein
MHPTTRKLIALIGLLGGLVAFTSSCGGQPPIVCTACTYKTASFALTSTQLQGGTITSATMHTEVTHPTCPYGTNSNPCTATLDIDVRCKTPGAGNFTIKKRPNGFSHGATSADATVNFVIALPRGGSVTVPVSATLSDPTPADTAATSPCGGSMDPNIQY